MAVDMQTGDLPKLEDLQEAMATSDLCGIIKQNRLRHRLGHKRSTKAAGPVASGDACYDRLRNLIHHFGPNCLDCTDQAGSSLVHLTALSCRKSRSLDLIHRTAGGLGCFRRRGAWNYSAAHYAAENPCNSALIWLVRKLGPDCLRDSDTEQRLTPLQICALCLKREDDSLMEFLCNSLQTSLFEQVTHDTRRNLFHLAAVNPNSSFVLLWLVERFGTGHLSDRDSLGNMAVHFAALMQDADTLKELHRCLKDDMFNLRGQQGETVAHCAAQNRAGSSALMWCLSQPQAQQHMQARNWLGQTPLHLAAQYQDTECLQLAVSTLGGECLTQTCGTLRTAFHYAAMNVRSDAVLRHLADLAGESAHQRLTQRDLRGNMPIHLAAKYQAPSCLSFICQRLGIDAFLLEGCNNWTLLHYALQSDGAALEKQRVIEQEIAWRQRCLEGATSSSQ